VPDLRIAAVAERHQVTVLHDDAGYKIVGGVTGQVGGPSSSVP
jgi:hypothetical protein